MSIRTRRLGCSIAKAIPGSKGWPRKENPFEPHLPTAATMQHFWICREPKWVVGELPHRNAVCQCERLMIKTANFSNLSQVKTLCTYQDLHCFTNKDPGSARSPQIPWSSKDRNLAAITAMSSSHFIFQNMEAFSLHNIFYVDKIARCCLSLQVLVHLG